MKKLKGQDQKSKRDKIKKAKGTRSNKLKGQDQKNKRDKIKRAKGTRSTS